MWKIIALLIDNLAPKMAEFGLMWQQFDTTITGHLTAIVTKNMTDLLSFSTKEKKMVAKAWNTRTEVQR